MADRITLRPTTAVIAHRGDSSAAPENTLAAARAAVAAGADAVEGDLHRTKDGALVVVHDRHLRRTTDVTTVRPEWGRARVADLTLAEVQQLDAGSWFGGAFKAQRVPTLREWATAIAGRAALLIEVKHPRRYPGIDLELGFELSQVPVLASAVALRALVIQCFDLAWLSGFRELVPHVRTGLLVRTTPTPAQIAMATRIVHQLNPSVDAADLATVRRLHDAGLGISVWTANLETPPVGRMPAGRPYWPDLLPRRLRQLLDHGVDGMITDHPGRLRALVDSRAEPSTLGA